MFTGSPRLIRVTAAILGGNEGGPTISGPIVIRDASIVIRGLGMQLARRRRCFSSAFDCLPSWPLTRALGAPDTGLVSGALSAGYPGHRSTRRPVPAGLERNEA